MASQKAQRNTITVLLSPAEFDRFDNYCRDRGFKKSTLISRLIRQFLDLEGYGIGPTNPRPQGPRAGRQG